MQKGGRQSAPVAQDAAAAVCAQGEAKARKLNVPPGECTCTGAFGTALKAETLMCSLQEKTRELERIRAGKEMQKVMRCAASLVRHDDGSGCHAIGRQLRRCEAVECVCRRVVPCSRRSARRRRRWRCSVSPRCGRSACKRAVDPLHALRRLRSLHGSPAARGRSISVRSGSSRHCSHARRPLLLCAATQAREGRGRARARGAAVQAGGGPQGAAAQAGPARRAH